MMQAANAKRGDVLVLVGTRKGAFILSSDPSRKRWSVSDPQFEGGDSLRLASIPGSSPGAGPAGDIFHMAYDPRDGGTVFAGVNSIIWGPEIYRSRDLGKTWQSSSEGPRFSGGDLTVKRVWHVEPGRADESGIVYAGVEPAALFKSEDGGDTWREIAGLTSHPTREKWQPGLGGLCLHSIVLDPSRHDRMWVGISAVGVFGTDDGGQSWRTMNQGIRADFLPDRYPEFGQCPHKVLAHKARPEVLFQQNYCGVFRSDSAGAGWQDITQDLPSRSGFVLGVHSVEPSTIYVLPEDRVTGEEVGGGMRFVTDAKFRVFRSRNAGKDWEPLTKGLPQKNAYLHVMREGMADRQPGPLRNLHRNQHRPGLLQPGQRGQLGVAGGLPAAHQLGRLRRGGLRPQLGVHTAWLN